MDPFWNSLFIPVSVWVLLAWRPWIFISPPSISTAEYHCLIAFIYMLLQIFQARLRPDSATCLQHDPRWGLPEPCDWPAFWWRPEHQLSLLHLQLLQQTMGGKQCDHVLNCNLQKGVSVAASEWEVKGALTPVSGVGLHHHWSTVKIKGHGSEIIFYSESCLTRENLRALVPERSQTVL